MDRKNSQAIMRVAAFVALCAAVGAIACSSDTIGLPRTDAQAATATAGGTDTTGSPGTSNEPVASVSVSPHLLSVPLGFYAHFIATPRDANGVTVAGKHATWTSSNTAILVASDTGIIYAKALGTAKIYGTIDGHTDSATVVVTPTPPDTSRNHSPPPPTPVSSFNLTLAVAGSVAGADTSLNTPVAGVSVAVMRVMSVRGDTLNPSVLAGTIVTDANGVGALQNLPGGYYTFLATPPAGSVYVKGSFGLGAPTSSDVRVRIVLPRAP